MRRILRQRNARRVGVRIRRILISGVWLNVRYANRCTRTGSVLYGILPSSGRIKTKGPMALADDPRLAGFGSIGDIAECFERRDKTSDAVLPRGLRGRGHFARRMESGGVAPKYRGLRL